MTDNLIALADWHRDNAALYAEIAENANRLYPVAMTVVAPTKHAFHVQAEKLIREAVLLLPQGGKYRHKKRGSEYTSLGALTVQAAKPIVEGDMMIAYVDDAGCMWGRPIDEFNDGRFEEITS